MQFVQYIMKFILCPRLIGESLDFFFTVAEISKVTAMKWLFSVLG